MDPILFIGRGPFECHIADRKKRKKKRKKSWTFCECGIGHPGHCPAGSYIRQDRAGKEQIASAPHSGDKTIAV